MENSYRIKKPGGEILGPLNKEEIKNLYILGKIDTSDQYQEDGKDTWAPLEKIEVLAPLIHGAANGKNLKEFDYDTSNDIAPIAPEELQKNYEKNAGLGGVEKTVINRKRRNLEELEKTILIKREEIEENEEEEKTEETSVEEAQEEESIDTEKETELINLENLKEIEQEALETEREIGKIKDVIKVKEEENKEEKKEEKKEEDRSFDSSKTKRKIKPIVALAFLVLAYFLLFDEEDTAVDSLKPQRINLVFPIQNEYLDKKSARKNLAEGIEFYKKGTYLAKVIAISKFRDSLKHQFKDNPALGFLILAYAELLPNAHDIKKATIILNNLVKMSENKVFSDINIAMGHALYFLNSGRVFTAIRKIENYIKVTKRPSRKFYSIYLKALVMAGDFVKAKRTFEMLKKSGGNLPPESYEAMAEYHRKDQRRKKGIAIILEGLKLYPNSVMLLLKRADDVMEMANIQLYEKTLNRIKELGYESCPSFYSKYLEHQGVLSAMKGQVAKATSYFKAALKEHETLELRSKLATLEIGVNKAAQNLILESKIIDEIEKAKKARKEYKWDKAFIHNINAVDMNRKYIPSHILLSDMQIERGHFKEAIQTLKKLKASYPNNIPIIAKLVDAYIESFRIHDALEEINLLSSHKNALESPYYNSILAKYFAKKKMYPMAASWYKRAVEKDPLRDDLFFAIASIYKKGNNIKSAKKYLMEAISLNPEEANYKILHSRLLAEGSSPSVVIGYLREELEKTKDRTAILGEIALNYYKSGQIKFFEETLDEVKSLGVKNESFYRFLVEASLLNDEEEKAIEYSLELLKVTPGDMDARIALAEIYLKKEAFNKAHEHLQEVKRRMSNYPKVNYYLAKVDYLRGSLEIAMQLAEEEIKKNSRSPFGFLIRGKILFKQGDLAKSVKSYEQTLFLDHQNVEALIDLARIRKRQNKFEPARELLLRAERIEGNRPDIHRELGFVYRGVGQGGLAIESFESYLNLAPGAPDSSEIKNVIQLLK